MNEMNKKEHFNIDAVQYRYPPDLIDCYYHRKANFIFKDVDYSILKKHCECCGRIVGEQPSTTICYDSLQLAYLGPGIPLYFIFAKAIPIFLFVYICIFGIYAVVKNLQGGDCGSCQSFTDYISLFNISKDIQGMMVQEFLLLASIVVTIVALIVLRCYMYGFQRYIDTFLLTPSDFSLIVRGIPNNAEKKDIEEMVQEMRPFLSQEENLLTDNLSIASILMISDMGEYLKEKNKKFQKYKKMLKNKQSEDNPDYSFLQMEKKNLPFAKTAIIIFNYPSSKQFFLQPSNGCERLIRYFWGSYYPKSSIHRIHDKYVSIARAPEPDELVWQNCGKQSWTLFFRRIFFYFLSFLILLLGGVLQLLIGYYRLEYINDQTTNEKQYLFSTVTAIIITIFNYVIISVMRLTVEYEKYDNKSQMKVALIIRVVFFQFLNTGVFVIAANVIAKLIKNGSFEYKQSFVTYDIFQIMAINTVVPNLVNLLINRFEIAKLPFRYFAKKNILQYTQLQANLIYQPPEVQIQYKYSYIFKTFWLTVFFLPTLPPVILVSFLGLLFNFLIEKYLFSGCYKAPETISAYVNSEVMNLLDYTLLWMTAGNFVVHLIIHNFKLDTMEQRFITIHIIFLCFSIINILFPYRAVMKKCMKLQEEEENEPYSKTKDTFQLNYENTNPIYKDLHEPKEREEQTRRQMRMIVQTEKFMAEASQMYI